MISMVSFSQRRRRRRRRGGSRWRAQRSSGEQLIYIQYCLYVYIWSLWFHLVTYWGGGGEGADEEHQGVLDNNWYIQYCLYVYIWSLWFHLVRGGEGDQEAY
jgi:hypothetical protein